MSFLGQRTQYLGVYVGTVWEGMRGKEAKVHAGVNGVAGGGRGPGHA